MSQSYEERKPPNLHSHFTANSDIAPTIDSGRSAHVESTAYAAAHGFHSSVSELKSIFRESSDGMVPFGLSNQQTYT